MSTRMAVRVHQLDTSTICTVIIADSFLVGPGAVLANHPIRYRRSGAGPGIIALANDPLRLGRFTNLATA